MDHVGYAVKDLEAAVRGFLLLGYRLRGQTTEDVERGVRIQFLADLAGAKVELVAPLREGSPVDGWLGKNGNSPYHLCYESGDMDRDVAALCGNGFIVVRPPSPAPALGGRRVVFLYSLATGTLEIVEREGADT